MARSIKTVWDRPAQAATGVKVALEALPAIEAPVRVRSWADISGSTDPANLNVPAPLESPTWS